MPAGVHKFEVEQGSYFERVLTWKDNAEALVNLTGYTARMHVRPSVTAQGPPTLELTTENGKIALGGAAGTITLTIAATETDDLVPGMYVYDLELVPANGKVKRLLKGEFSVDAEVTRP